MSSTSISSLPAHVPESVSKAVAAFGLGNFSLLQVRQAIALALEVDPTRAEPIHELLDDELKARNLTIADYGELISAIGAVASENIPTECSDDAPDQSGVYRVVEQGTLVPTDLNEWPEFKAHIDAGSGSEDNESSEANQHTRPFDLAPVEEVISGAAEASADSEADELVVAEPGTVLRDRFRLEEELARGAMGVVFRATDLMKLDAGADDPQVAVKLVSPEIAGDKNALRAFQNEFVNTQHLSHPSIIRVFELDRDGDQYFITMEWLEGQSLASLLDSSRESALPHTQTYAIIEQLCDALIYAHEHNVVHADVKPGNVFLLDSGEVKLIDFGIARNESDMRDQTGEEGDKAVALTPAYASCERLEKRDPAPRDDLYSLASLIYRLIAGRRVFGPLTALEAEAQGAEAVRIGGMDDRRWGALSKALAFRRGNRQSSVQAFSDEFGRRSQPRVEDNRQAIGVDSVVEDSADDTARLPVLDAAPDASLADDIPLPADIEIDFPLDEDAAEAPEPELSGIFDVAALSGDNEEIVMSSEPEAVPQQIEYPPPQGDKPKAKEPPLTAAISNITATQKWVIGAIVALIILLAAGLSLLGGDDESPPARTVTVPKRAEPAVIEQSKEVFEPAIADQIAIEEGLLEEPSTVAADFTESSLAQEELGTPQPARLQPERLQSEPTALVEPEPQAEIAAAQPKPAQAAAEPNVAVQAEPPGATKTEPAVLLDATALKTPENVDAERALADVATAQIQDTVEAAATPAVSADPEGELAVPEDELSATGASASEPLLAAVAEPAANPSDFTIPKPALATVPVPEPADVPAPAPEIVLLSELDFIEYAEPRYPRSSRDRRYEGWVDLEFRIGADGFPIKIEVVDSNLPAKFERASLAAVEKWQFEPYLHEGAPIAVNSAVRLRFSN